MKARETAKNPEKLLQMRLLVGALGEKSRFGWWQTSFFDPSSQAFLTPIFVKTASLAMYHGVVEAARRVHDESLNVGSFHLFRFREELEQDLHTLMQGPVGTRLSGVARGDKDACLISLQAMFSAATQMKEGPISLGKIADPRSEEFIEKVAGAYHAAFSSGQRSFPYFASSE